MSKPTTPGPARGSADDMGDAVQDRVAQLCGNYDQLKFTGYPTEPKYPPLSAENRIERAKQLLLACAEVSKQGLDFQRSLAGKSPEAFKEVQRTRYLVLAAAGQWLAEFRAVILEELAFDLLSSFESEVRQFEQQLYEALRPAGGSVLPQILYEADGTERVIPKLRNLIERWSLRASTSTTKKIEAKTAKDRQKIDDLLAAGAKPVRKQRGRAQKPVTDLDQRVLDAKYKEDLEHKEIAKRLGITVETVNQIIDRHRQREKRARGRKPKVET